jgi:hypothetical protein
VGFNLSCVYLNGRVGFSEKNPQTLDLDHVVLIGDYIGCTQSCFAHTAVFILQKYLRPTQCNYLIGTYVWPHTCFSRAFLDGRWIKCLVQGLIVTYAITVAKDRRTRTAP